MPSSDLGEVFWSSPWRSCFREIFGRNWMLLKHDSTNSILIIQLYIDDIQYYVDIQVQRTNKRFVFIENIKRHRTLNDLPLHERPPLKYTYAIHMQTKDNFPINILGHFMKVDLWFAFVLYARCSAI